MNYDAFISYAREDGAVARRIVDGLRERGISCWFDSQELQLGDKYDLEIERAICASGVVLWLVSSHSIASDYVMYEIHTACTCKRQIGPIFLGSADASRFPPPLNLKLANVQGIEWIDGEQEANIEKLTAEVRRLLGRLRLRRAAAVGGVGGRPDARRYPPTQPGRYPG